MQVIDISTNGTTAIAPQIATLLREDYYINIHTVEASAISSFTAMRVASELKKNAADVIICHRRKDLLGAIGARKLAPSERRDFKIIYAPATIDDIEANITEAYAKEIAATVLPAQLSYPRHCTVIEPGCLTETTVTKAAEAPAGGPLNIVWAGPIDEEQRLWRLIRAVAAQSTGQYAIHVYGTGPARSVMPIVKGSRTMTNLNITWHGDEPTLDQALAEAHLGAETHTIVRQPEMVMRRLGIPVLDTADSESLSDTLTRVADDRGTLGDMRRHAKEEYEERFNPKTTARNWQRLLTSLI